MTPKNGIRLFFVFSTLLTAICWAHPRDDVQRVVTLAPSLGELVADVLGNRLERIVGVSEYTDYPPALKSRPSIGPYHHFSIEKVISLKPDLVLATTDGNSPDQVRRLRELGLTVVAVNTENFDDIEKTMRSVGALLGFEKDGIRMAQQFHHGLDRIQTAARGHSPVRVLLQVGDSPLVVAGKRSFLNSALSLLGAQNVYSTEGLTETHYPRPSVEDVISRNPDVIVIVALGDDLAAYQRMKSKWSQFKSLKAVQNGKIFVIRSDALLRPTMRLLEGLNILNKTIYGKS